MSEERQGDWLQTASGRQFWPLDPRADEIHPEDIAHALANQCRFSGHCEEHYSVAEHSVRVSDCAVALYTNGDYAFVEPRDVQAVALWGLLHDASAAYLVDLPRPIKRNTSLGLEYQKIEAYLMQVICDRFGLPHTMPGPVHQADDIVLMTEARDLMKPPPVPWKETGTKPLDEEIIPWGPEEAERRFLARYRWCIGEAERLCGAKRGFLECVKPFGHLDDHDFTRDRLGNSAPVERRETRVPSQPAGDYHCTGCGNVIARSENVVEVQTMGRPPRTVYAHGKCEALVQEIAEQEAEMGYAAAVHGGSRIGSKKAGKK